jgi:hypothetical protein
VLPEGPEGLGKLEKIHLIGTRSRDLPACSIATHYVPVINNHKQELAHVAFNMLYENLAAT